jgi:hypothetical protein
MGLQLARRLQMHLSSWVLASDSEEEQVSREPTKSSEEMVKTADELRIQGQLEEALKWAKRASGEAPSNGVRVDGDGVD